MTQEAPNVETGSTPEPKASNALITAWNSLSKGAKIGVAVLVAVVFFYAIGSSSNSTPSTPTVTVPTTLSVGDQYAAWKAELAPVISQTQTDYTQTQVDLSNADYAASKQDFATLSQDATDIASLANSPDVTINNDVLDLAASIQELATAGIYALDNNDLTSFYAALDHYGKATDKLTNDLETANNKY